MVWLPQGVVEQETHNSFILVLNQSALLSFLVGQITNHLQMEKVDINQSACRAKTVKAKENPQHSICFHPYLLFLRGQWQTGRA